MSRIGLIGENSIEYVSHLLDVWNAGDSVVLIDWRIPADSAAWMLKEAGAEYCLIDSRYRERFTDRHCDSICFRTYTVTELLPGVLPEWVYEKYVPSYTEDEAVILYSSGTTGKSKGIILSHYAISTNADAIIDYMKPEKEDCIYLVKSLTHSSTLVGEMLVALKAGVRLLIANTVVPPRVVFRNIERFQVSILCVNPTLLQLYMEEVNRLMVELDSLKIIYVSGAVLSETICEKARETFQGVEVYNIYGLTEAGPRVAAQRRECCNGNSVGRPIAGVEVVIVNEENELAAVRERGLVHIRTQSRCSGYVTGEEKQPSLYKDWMNTGDIGYLDEHGELHICGRMDDMIIVDAHKIYPAQVEEHIRQISGVRDCVVTGIPSEQRTVLGCLYTGQQEIRLEDKKLLQKILPLYEIPQCYVRVDELPRTNNGKVSRREALQVMLDKMKGGTK